MTFKNHTQYTRYEDIKRLRFIENEMAKKNLKNIKILDVGCGNGNIAMQLGNSGNEVLGIDISEEAIEKAKQNNSLSNVTFKHLAVEALAVENKFDVIVCSEVLEHLHQPEIVVASLEQRLAKDGLLIITVPNGFGPREVFMTKPMQWAMKRDNYLWRFIKGLKKIFGYSGKTIQSDAADLSHIQFFSEKSLIQLLGSKTLELRTFNVSNFVETVFPFSLITKRSMRLQKLDAKLADMLPHRFASGFMTTWNFKKKNTQKSSDKTRVLMTIRQGKIGGGETHVLDLVKALDRQYFEPFVLSFTPGPMVDELKKLNIPCRVIHTEKPFDFKVWKKVSALIQSFQIDILHAHGTRALSNSFWAAKKTGVPIIYTVHGWSFHQNDNVIKYRLKLWSESFLTKQAQCVINVSNSNQNDGINKFNMKRSAVIYNGINQDKFNTQNDFNDIRASLQIPKDKLLVGYIARFTSQKDPYTMMEAILLSLKQNDALVFLMVGDGALRTPIETLIDKHQLKNKVIFTGFRTDIPDILNALDIYCLPSLWEGLPIGLLEAMAMGKAVIATAVDGTKELIESGVNGILIDTKSPKELSENILRLASNAFEMKALGDQAKQFVKDFFDIKKMTKATEQVYEQIHSNALSSTVKSC
jgi:glycosyltransferase involved in cell wall biosynthesis/ubiquinone/menaquinone biosynthesis C-methylase UbiE